MPWNENEKIKKQKTTINEQRRVEGRNVVKSKEEEDEEEKKGGSGGKKETHTYTQKSKKRSQAITKNQLLYKTNVVWLRSLQIWM